MNSLKRATTWLEDFSQQFTERLVTKDDEQRQIRLASLGIILVVLLVLWYFLS
jgi:hypothetical protein